MGTRRILVIKLGALGDIVLALGPMAAIRRHHAADHVTLLTTAPYAAFLGAAPYADEVWVDERPRPWRPDRVVALARRLRAGRFERVYDLQTSDRTAWYRRLFRHPAPEWSGHARGASHRHDDPARSRMHTVERHQAQLAIAGIAAVPAADLSWATVDLARFALPRRYAVLAPGAAPHRPEKRWPAERFAALARWLAGQGCAPALVGTAGEAEALGAVAAACPDAIDLGGRTSLVELAALCRGAALAVGNDSGPMHVAAVAGCPTFVLFSAASDPARTAPRGPHVRVLRTPRLDDLELDAVRQAVAPCLGRCP